MSAGGGQTRPLCQTEDTLHTALGRLRIERAQREVVVDRNERAVLVEQHRPGRMDCFFLVAMYTLRTSLPRRRATKV